MKAASFDELYGEVIRSHGIATVPLALYRYQGRLGLSLAEIGLIGSLLSFRWTKAAPYPSLRTLSAQTGIARSTLHDELAELARRGFVTIERRPAPDGGLASNAYHFDPLFERLIDLILADQESSADGDDWTPALSEPDVPPTPPSSNGNLSGRPHTPVRRVRRHLSGHDRPGVSGHDRTKVDSSEIDTFEVDTSPPSQNCARDAEPPEPAAPGPRRDAEPRPSEDLLPTIRHLARRVANGARRAAWHRQLAADLADYVAKSPLSAAQLERLVRLVEAHGPLRTEAEFWERLDLYRLTYVQPQAVPASAIVPAEPSAPTVGSPLELAKGRQT